MKNQILTSYRKGFWTNGRPSRPSSKRPRCLFAVSALLLLPWQPRNRCAHVRKDVRCWSLIVAEPKSLRGKLAKFDNINGSFHEEREEPTLITRRFGTTERCDRVDHLSWQLLHQCEKCGCAKGKAMFFAPNLNLFTHYYKYDDITNSGCMNFLMMANAHESCGVTFLSPINSPQTRELVMLTSGLKHLWWQILEYNQF